METLLRRFARGSLVAACILLGLRSEAAHARPAATTPTCQAGSLQIAPDLTTGATGHIAMELRMRNTGARPCALKGFATLVLLDGARRPLPTVLSWGSSYFTILNRPVRLVTLAPGGSAYLALGWAHIPTLGQSCPAAPNLLVLPPGASTALLVSLGRPSARTYGPIDACGGAIAVSPVESTPFSL